MILSNHHSARVLIADCLVSSCAAGHNRSLGFSAQAFMTSGARRGSCAGERSTLFLVALVAAPLSTRRWRDGPARSLEHLLRLLLCVHAGNPKAVHRRIAASRRPTGRGTSPNAVPTTQVRLQSIARADSRPWPGCARRKPV